MKRLVTVARSVRQKLGPVWWHTFLLFIASRLGDAINLYIGMFLVYRFISRDELGAILPVTRFAAVIAVPLTVVARTAMKYVNVFAAAEEHGKVRALLRDLLYLSSVLSLCVAGSMWLAWPFMRDRMKIDDSVIAWLIAISAVLSCWAPILGMVTQGLKRFHHYIAGCMARPVVRLVVVLLFMARMQVAGYLLATVVASSALCAILLAGLLRYFREDVPRVSYRDLWPEMLRYGGRVSIFVVAQAVLLAVEPLIIRHRLSAVDSAGYYTAVMFGSIPMWVAPAVLPFLFPIVSERHERGQSTRELHGQALLFAGSIGILISVLLFYGAEWVFSLRPAWNEYAAYAPFAWRVALIATVDTVFMVHMTHENACRRFAHLLYYVPIVAIELALLYSLMGWSFFRPTLPCEWWQAVEGFVRRDLSFVLWFMLGARAVLAACIAGELRLRVGAACAPRSRGDGPFL